LILVPEILFDAPPLLLLAMIIFNAFLFLAVPVLSFGRISRLPFLVAGLLSLQILLAPRACACSPGLILVIGSVSIARVAPRQTHAVFR
jgi:hypothetical protein